MDQTYLGVHATFGLSNYISYTSFCDGSSVTGYRVPTDNTRKLTTFLIATVNLS